MNRKVCYMLTGKQNECHESKTMLSWIGSTLSSVEAPNRDDPARHLFSPGHPSAPVSTHRAPAATVCPAQTARDAVWEQLPPSRIPAPAAGCSEFTLGFRASSLKSDKSTGARRRRSEPGASVGGHSFPAPLPLRTFTCTCSCTPKKSHQGTALQWGRNYT